MPEAETGELARVEQPFMHNRSTTNWTRHFFYRAEKTRTTWLFRFGLLALLLIGGWTTKTWWTAALARSLVCDRTTSPSDAILVEDFDPDYLVFERASQLRQQNVAPRVLVPIPADGASHQPNAVASGIAHVMAKLSRLGDIVEVPVTEREPISLNAARDVLGFVTANKIRSVVVVTPLFRSERSALVYRATLAPSGVTIRCEPVQGTRGVEDWTRTWHGFQEIAEQWVKLQYYRFYVLPFRLHATSSSPSQA